MSRYGLPSGTFTKAGDSNAADVVGLGKNLGENLIEQHYHRQMAEQQQHYSQQQHLPQHHQQHEPQHLGERLFPAPSALYGVLQANLTTPAASGVEVVGAGAGSSGRQPGCDAGIVCSPEYILQVATAVTVGLAAIGTVGNILTVIAIANSRLRNNINSILICNLSLADAVYCGLVLPLQAAAFHSRCWPLSPVICEFHAALRIWLIGVNMMLLSFIALYRFLHVVHPHSYSQYSRRPWFLSACALCWTLPAVFSTTALAHFWGEFGFQERILQCTFGPDSSKSHKITTITAGYLVPCVFISVCYARIGCVVFRSRHRAVKSGSVYRRQRARRDSFRLTGMMVLIFVGFLLGTTPYFVVNSLDARLRRPLAHLITPVLAWIMYGTHPIIYTMMDAKFQLAYRRLFACMLGLRHLAPPPDAETSARDGDVGGRQTSQLVRRESVLAATGVTDKEKTKTREISKEQLGVSIDNQ